MSSSGWVSDLFVDPVGLGVLRDLFHRVAQVRSSPANIVWSSKQGVLRNLFPADVRRLASDWEAAVRSSSSGGTSKRRTLEAELRDFIAALDVDPDLSRGFLHVRGGPKGPRAYPTAHGGKASRLDEPPLDRGERPVERSPQRSGCPGRMPGGRPSSPSNSSNRR